VQRARLWRYLTGDETYDVDHYLTRLEGRAALLADASLPDASLPDGSLADAPLDDAGRTGAVPA
jgi:hypothetical protein